MSLLSNLFHSPETRGSLENPAVSLQDADGWFDMFGWGGESESGERVSVQTSLSLSGFWCALKMISGDTSKLPLLSFNQPEPLGKPSPDPTHYLTQIIGPRGMANKETTAIKLWRRAMVQALIYEQAFLWVEWKKDGSRVKGIHLLLSDRTEIVRHKGKLWVITEVDMDSPRVVARPADEVIHIEGLCIDGLAGCKLVNAAREDIGSALASRNFKAKFFKHGLNAGGILQAPEGASSTAIRKIEDALVEHHTTSKKAFRTMVLKDNFKWHSTQVHPEQAQLIEIDEAGIRDLARRFLLSPGRLGVSESVSYNSLEMERRNYHDTALSYWLSMIAAEATAKLLTEQERRAGRFVDYDVNLALLWADAKTLAQIGTQGVRTRDQYNRPLFEADEVRAWFNLPARDTDGPPPLPAPDPPADSTRSAESREAFRSLLGEAFGRLVRRLDQHAERARKKGGLALRTWAQSMDVGTHGDVAREALAPAAEAARSVGLTELDGEQLAAEFFAAYRAAIDSPEDRSQLATALAAQIIPEPEKEEQ